MTQEEQILYDLWKTVFTDIEFGIEDDFFELGGTSLQALELLGEISDRYAVDIKEIFESATIKDIASTMKLNPNWTEQRLKFIFQKHGVTYPNKEELKEYKKLVKNTKIIKSKTPRYKSVLLLGGTGFLGSYILKELLGYTDCKINIIVRAENDEKAALRVKETLEFYFKDSVELSTRVKCYSGDLTKSQFGLSKSNWEYLIDNVDAVLNSAALVKHMGKKNDFLSANVRIVESIIDFSSKGRKKDIHHISSIGIIFGDQSDTSRTIYTEVDLDVGQILDNDYLESKLKAEKLLDNYRSDDVNANIYRLDGVLFDSINGVFQRNIDDSSAYTFIKALYTLKVIPDIGAYNVNISMVDEIAKAYVKLVMHCENKNQTYHLMHPTPIAFSKVIKMLASREDNFKVLDADRIFELYKNIGDDEEASKAFGKILFNCEIFDSIMKNKYHIQNALTIKALSKIGFKWKPVKRKNLKKAYSYVKEINWI